MMKSVFGIVLVFVFLVSAMALAVEPADQNAWRLYLRATDSQGSYSTGSITIATATNAVDGYDPPIYDQDVYFNPIRTTQAYVAGIIGPHPLWRDVKSTKSPRDSAYAPSYEKIWDIRAGAFPDFADQTIRLTLKDVAAGAGVPPLKDADDWTYRYFVRMVDNKQIADDDPLFSNGMEWEISMPAAYTTSTLWTLDLPTRLVTKDAVGMLDGYQMQFVQTAVVPEPSSFIALGALMMPLLGLRRRTGK